MPTTTARLLQLLSLLQIRDSWSGTMLAARLQTTDRTVRRDIDRLRELGYNIQATKGPAGGYRLAAGNDLPPLLFDDEQAVAIALALQTVPGAGVGIEDAALRALTTVRQVMPSRVCHRLDALEVTTLTGRTGEKVVAPVPTDLLVSLSTAIRARHVVRIDYPAHDPGESGEPRPPRRVEPHHLVTAEGRWYLVAWDLERDDWRIFRVDRLRPRVPTGPRFSPRRVPGDDVGQFVAARFKGSDVDRWACWGTVILNAPARDVRPFAGDGVVHPIDDSHCRLEAGAWSWEGLAASLGRFGVPLEVVESPELAAAFATLAERYATTAAGGAVVMQTSELG